MSVPKGYVEKVKEVRLKLGCGLIEAKFFVDKHGVDKADAEVEKIRASNKVYESPETCIRNAIKSFYRKLDSGLDVKDEREKTFAEIEDILCMSYPYQKKI